MWRAPEILVLSVTIAEPRGAGDRRVRLSDETESRLGGPAWFDVERADAIVGSLYPLRREPGSHSVQKRREGIAAR